MKKKGWIIVVGLLSVIILLTCLINGALLPQPNKVIIKEKKEYARIISLFDPRPCWMDICPGITTIYKVRQKISENFELEKNDIAYWGNDNSGGVDWYIIPPDYYTKNSITWNNGIVKLISLYVMYSDEKIDFYIKLFGEPEYVFPFKHWQADTPDYWTIGLYYPNKGIRIFVQNRSGTDLFQKDDNVNSILLFIPMDINDVFQQEFESYHNENPLISLKKWHGYGDLNKY